MMDIVGVDFWVPTNYLVWGHQCCGGICCPSLRGCCK